MSESYIRTVFRPEYVDLLGGDHLAALMLGQIVYWYLPAKNGGTKLRVSKGGHWWVVKSHVDWERELRLTRSQSQRCLAVLREKGIIETERYLFNGHPTIHLRLKLVTGNLIPIAGLDVFHCSLVGIPLLADKQCITETTAETTTASKTANEFAPEIPQEETGMGIDDILKQHQAKQASLPTGKIGPANLALLWRKRMSTLTEGKYQKALTGKDMGQLKQLVTALGNDALGVVDWALQNWSTFAWEAKSRKGLNSAPQEPMVGFLLMYHDVALHLIATPAPVKAKVKALVKIDKPVLVADNTQEEKAGEADIAATLALLDQMSGS